MSNSEPPYREIADSTYDWEMWVDGTGKLRWVNPAVERFTGYSVAECSTMSEFPLCVVHPDDRPKMQELFDGALRGTSGNDLEFRVRHRDGSVRWAAISWQPLRVRGFGPPGYRTSVRDIDQRKEFEERLRLAEREAARSAEERTEFLASLSHELRSPLHCIAGFSEMLGRSELDASQRRWVDILGEQSRAVLRLVEDLLQFVAGERNVLTLQHLPFDLVHLASAEVEVARTRCAPGVTVRFVNSLEGEVLVTGDQDRVRQILANLLTNAMRFTERGFVEVRLENRDAGRIALIVEDSGIGMSPELLERIREPFVQGAPSSSASRGGVGLGLAIVDRLVRAMGGALSIGSKPGKGTRAEVVLSLPRAPRADDSPQAPETSATENPVPLRVLVVDDLAAARELVVAMLADAGIEARQAASGAEALAAAGELHPDLIFIDYHMPGLDGVDTARMLRAGGALGPSSTIALLTANVLANAAGESPPPGIDRVLTKPMRLSHLRELLDEARARVVSGAELLDLEVLNDLRSMRDEHGRSLLERRGADLLAALREALGELEAAHDDAVRSHAAHALKGLAASLGAAALARACGEIEARARDGSFGLRDGNLTRVRELLDRSESAITRLIESDVEARMQPG